MEEGNMCADLRAERKIHETHSAETLQAQQLRQLRAAAQQI